MPHFLLIPYPILGHVNPFMQLSQALAKHGCNITLLSTEFNLKRVNKSASTCEQENALSSHINLVSLPDGLDAEDDRSDFQKLLSSVKNTMPALLPKLIEEINGLDDGERKISCIVVSINMGWALQIGQRLGIKGALLWPSSATVFGFCDSIKSLIDDGIIDSECGLPIKDQKIQVLPSMPPIDAVDLPWYTLGKFIFKHFVQEMQTLKLADWWLCNTMQELEPQTFSISPRLTPIGPLMLASRHHHQHHQHPDHINHDDINPNPNPNPNPISFWEEDTTCLHWLDQHSSQSVIYVSFGSIAVLKPNQFTELAHALDLLDRPFLWVVRPSNDHNNNNNAIFPHEFKGSKGKIVGWAPQRKVLNHPSIACFVSHCGWNSTIEGLCGGVPFLCWPFFSDQCVNKLLICDLWKVGMGFEKDEESGIISRGEIKEKVENVLENYEDIKARSLKLKELVLENMGEDGLSSRNLNKFIHWAQE